MEWSEPDISNKLDLYKLEVQVYSACGSQIFYNDRSEDWDRLVDAGGTPCGRWRSGAGQLPPKTGRVLPSSETFSCR